MNNQYGQDANLFFVYPKKIIEGKGKKAIHVWSSTDDTKRVTVTITITVSQDKLPLLVMLEGTEGGCNAQNNCAHNMKNQVTYIKKMHGWIATSC